MKSFIRCLALAFIMAVSAGGSAQAYMIDPIAVGNWEGGAYYNDNSRQFSHCAVGVSYQNGVYLIMAWEPNGLTLGFLDERWNGYNVGSQVNMGITIDNVWESEGPAEVIAPGQLVTILGREPRPVTAMRRGLMLTATVGKESFDFQLTNTNAAIDALVQCYRRHS